LRTLSLHNASSDVIVCSIVFLLFFKARLLVC
jgi:hypothetical protein